MTREEAALVLEALYGDWDPLDEKNWQALRKAIAALRGPVPDPETGLVPCGCGGEATVCDEYEFMWAYKCNLCDIRTGGFTELADARDAWNGAMGYKPEANG